MKITKPRHIRDYALRRKVLRYLVDEATYHPSTFYGLTSGSIGRAFGYPQNMIRSALFTLRARGKVYSIRNPRERWFPSSRAVWDSVLEREGRRG